MISILTYNVFFGKKLPQVVNWLSKLKPKPDIICLQEFPESQLAVLKDFEKLFGYQTHFAPATIKKDQTYGELTLHSTNKLNIISSQIIYLGNSLLEKTLFRHAAAHKSALLTQFEYNKQILSVVNVHLGCFTSNTTRLNQLQTIISQNHVSSQPVIILGDYNYSNLTGSKRLLRFMAKHNYSPFPNQDKTHEVFMIKQQLDYIFYRHLQPHTLKVLNVKLSDHYPLLATFKA